METLIFASDGWALWALLLICAAIGFWFEKTYPGARVSGAVLTMLAAFALSNTGVIPAQSKVYGTVVVYLVPLAIPLLLFQANLKQLLRESGTVFVAFLLGIVGTLIGVLIAYWLIPVGDEAWKLVTMFIARYIGGPINYFGIADVVKPSNNALVAAGVAASSLMIMFYFIILFALVSIRTLRLQFKEPLTDRWGATAVVVVSETRKGTSIHVPTLSTGLALSAAICAVGIWVERTYNWPGTSILTITAITVVLATVLPKPMARLEGANEFGILLMQLFFAVIGASANIAAVSAQKPVLLAFVVIIVVVHLLFVVLIGRLLKLSLPEIVIASNASIGGPATAAAMASARRWHHLLIPAILCGSLGYLVANVIALTISGWLK